ncbi:MAG: hypothetical protein U1F46_10845 [Marinagarivorans sp.]
MTHINLTKTTCDLYLCQSVSSDDLDWTRLIDRNFALDKSKPYIGYLGLNGDRLAMIPLITQLRNKNIICYSVPITYRDNKNICQEEARALAQKHAAIKLLSACKPRHPEPITPLFYLFNLASGVKEIEKTGGVIMVDRLDGHIWSAYEHDQYMYDFNNVF